MKKKLERLACWLGFHDLEIIRARRNSEEGYTIDTKCRVCGCEKILHT